jgi:membrane-bound lytic murein transglycosylase B
MLLSLTAPGCVVPGREDSMGSLRWIIAGVFLMLVVTTSAHATVVKMETAALLADLSEQSVDAAFRQAVETCIRGAAAMGLSKVWLDQVDVVSNHVVVRILATDDVQDDEDQSDITDSTPSRMNPHPGVLLRAPGVRVTL